MSTSYVNESLPYLWLSFPSCPTSAPLFIFPPPSLPPCFPPSSHPPSLLPPSLFSPSHLPPRVMTLSTQLMMMKTVMEREHTLTQRTTLSASLRRYVALHNIVVVNIHVTVWLCLILGFSRANIKTCKASKSLVYFSCEPDMISQWSNPRTHTTPTPTHTPTHPHIHTHTHTHTHTQVCRVKNRWKFLLKDGVMHINGHDYIFNKSTGEADW